MPWLGTPLLLWWLRWWEDSVSSLQHSRAKSSLPEAAEVLSVLEHLPLPFGLVEDTQLPESNAGRLRAAVASVKVSVRVRVHIHVHAAHASDRARGSVAHSPVPNLT